MSFELHKPVLLKNFLEQLSYFDNVQNYLDCTFGRGGHAAEVLQAFPEAKLFAVDQDQEALDYAKSDFVPKFQDRELQFFHENFMTMDFVEKGIKDMDLILADLGVSSPQYDQAERGFSFNKDGPLDMRMDRRKELTAAEIINEWDEEDLIDLFKNMGEHRRPFRVVRAIVNDRKEKPYTSTRELASLIERVDGWKKKGSHPATKYFMALRLQVNQEINLLPESLENLIRALRPGGRLFVISFHSMEDRIIKHRFKDLQSFGKIVNKKVIQADEEELQDNPRARTAKLRIFERG